MFIFDSTVKILPPPSFSTPLTISNYSYQPGGQSGFKPEEGKDPLSDAKVCLRDAAVMQSLGINTIRVYNIDPTINHDECASIFNYAGIYLMLDVNSPLPGQSIHRHEPETSYHSDYLKRIFQMVEAFKNYPNTLAFFAANEVINDVATAEHTPPYIRVSHFFFYLPSTSLLIHLTFPIQAVVRDLRTYIKANSDRAIPVGYSAADVRDVLEDSWQYMQCSIEGEDGDLSRSDFFALNSYSWCGGKATFQTSGYDKLVEMFKSTSIPVFFSEYGCNEVRPRVFNEVQSIYGTDLTLFSGGLVYEYTQEEADYGLLDENNDKSVKIRQDYLNLQDQYNKLDINLLQSTDADKSSIKPPKCSKDLIKSSSFNSSFKLPQIPSDAAKMLKSRVQGSQNGKLVTVKETKSPYPVYKLDGSAIQGLEIKQVKDGQSNAPSGSSLNGGGKGKGGDKDGAAGAVRSSSSLYLVCAVLSVLICALV